MGGVVKSVTKPVKKVLDTAGDIAKPVTKPISSGLQDIYDVGLKAPRDLALETFSGAGGVVRGVSEFAQTPEGLGAIASGVGAAYGVPIDPSSFLNKKNQTVTSQPLYTGNQSPTQTYVVPKGEADNQLLIYGGIGLAVFTTIYFIMRKRK